MMLLINNPVASPSYSYLITIPWSPWRRDQSLLCCLFWIDSPSRDGENCNASSGLQSGENTHQILEMILFGGGGVLLVLLCYCAKQLFNY